MLRTAGFVNTKPETAVMNLVKLAGEAGVQGRCVLLGTRDSVMKSGGLGRFTSVEELNRAMEEHEGFLFRSEYLVCPEAFEGTLHIMFI